MAIHFHSSLLCGESVWKYHVWFHCRQVSSEFKLLLFKVHSHLNFLFQRYGRRTSFFCLLFMEVSLSIVTCFSPNYVVFTVLRTINGFTFPALFQIPFILSKSVNWSLGIAEIVLKDHSYFSSWDHGSRLSNFCGHDDLSLLRRGPNGFGRIGIHIQLLVRVGPCHFSSIRNTF